MVVATGELGAARGAALALAPMSVIQVALAAGMVFIAVMADRLFGFDVGPRQWIGLSLTAIGLVMLGLTLPAMHGMHSQFSQAAMISFEAGLFGLGGLLIMGPRMGGPVEHHGVMLGAAAGILFGVSDTAIKALTGITLRMASRSAAQPWLLVAVLASIVAFYASARGLQDGEAVPVIAVTGTAANIAGIAGGIIVFGDPMAASPLGVVLQATAFVLVVVAAALMPAPVRSAGVASRAGARALLPSPPNANHLSARAQGPRDSQEEARHPGPEVRERPQEEGRRAAATWGVHARVYDDPEEA